MLVHIRRWKTWIARGQEHYFKRFNQTELEADVKGSRWWVWRRPLRCGRNVSVRLVSRVNVRIPGLVMDKQMPTGVVMDVGYLLSGITGQKKRVNSWSATTSERINSCLIQSQCSSVRSFIQNNTSINLFGKKSKNTFGFLRPTAEIDFPFFSWCVWESWF